jgi:Ni2+-binding GTPase involved in maturation of urease and hydrogenase
LDTSAVPIQGPPGAGKTFTGARMICELVRNGKKVGITAVSHEVIRKLLDEVVKAAGEMNLAIISCAHRKEDADSGARARKETPRSNRIAGLICPVGLISCPPG